MLAGFGYGDQGFKDLFRILSQSLCQFHAGMLAGCLFPAAVHIGDFGFLQNADCVGFYDFSFAIRLRS